MTQYKHMKRARLIHELEMQRDSRERLEAIFAGSRDAVFISDESSRLILVNAAACELTGHSREELLEMRIPDLHEEVDLHAYRAHHDSIMEGQEALTEAEVLRKDGTKVVTEFNNRRIMIAGTPFMHTVARDITERRRVEESLALSERRLREAHRAANLGHWSWDFGTGELFWSEENYRIFGLPLDTFPTYQVFENCIHPEDLVFVNENVKAALEEDAPYDVEFRIVHSGGEERVVHALGRVNRGTEGQSERFFGTVQDITERKRAEEEMSLHSEIMTNMQEAVYLVRARDGAIVFTNPEFERMFGYSDDEMLGEPVSIVNAPTDKGPEETASEITAALLEEGIWSGEVHNIKKDGTRFWCGVRATSFEHHEHGTVYLATHTDITKRKRAEEALRESEEKFRRLFEHAPLGYQSLDEDGNLIEINETWCGLLGYTKEEVLGRNFSEFISPDSRQVFTENFPTLKRVGYTHGVEFQLIRKDGSEISVSFDGKTEHNDDGSFRQTYCVLTDLTDRKQAEAEKRKLESRWQSVTESSPDLILVIDPDLNIQSANRGSPGLTRKDLIGKPIREFVDESQWPKVKKALGKALLGRSVTYETTYVGPDGEEIRYESRVVPRKSGGQVLDLVLSARDITERKEAEEEVRKSRDLLANLARLVPGVIYQYRLWPDGRSAFPYSSPGMWGIYEVTPEEVQEDATPVFGRLHPDDYDFVSEAIFESARTLNTFYCEFRVILPEQGLRWRWSQAQPERMADGGTLWHGIISDVTARKQAAEEVRNSRDRLRNLTLRLDEVREEERTALARELHDEVGQAMAAMRMDLAMVEEELLSGQGHLADRLYSMMALAEDSIDRVNRMSSALRSPILDMLGLEAAVESEVWEYQERWGIEVGLELELGGLEALPERDLVVYRILKEALANAREHAQAGRIDVSLRVEEEVLGLEVLDDGIGITDEQMRDLGSLGLIGMQERVERIGGFMRIDRRPEGGTRIRASVPLGSADRRT